MFFHKVFGASVATVISAMAVTAFNVPALAQETIDRSDAFNAVLANPGDPAAMLTYARASVADRDYEAAVSTLERLLDFEPNHSAARYELAVAYFALGSYEISRFHFALLRQIGSLNETQNAQVDDYLARIERAAQDQAISGIATIGAAVADGEPALALGVNLGWTVDLGGANDNTWQTDLIGQAYEGEDAISTGRLRLRTGPQFAIDGLAFGTRLRPYLEIEAVQDDDGDDYLTTSVGVQYSNAHSANWSTFADLSFGQLNGHASISDAETWEAILGASYTPSREVRVRFSLRASERDADIAADTRDRLGARVDYIRAGTGIFGDEDRRWQAAGYLQYDVLDYSEIGRDDTLTAVGVSLRTFVSERAFVEVAASSTQLDSNFTGGNATTPIFSVQFGMEF